MALEGRQYQHLGDPGPDVLGVCVELVQGGVACHGVAGRAVAGGVEFVP